MREQESRLLETIIGGETRVIPVHERIKEQDAPLFIWGTGALAIGVYEYCKRNNVVVQGCFVNVDIAQDTFMDMPVLSIDQLDEQYERYSVIIGHADYKGGINFLQSKAKCESIYCLSSACYNMCDLIPKSFLEDNLTHLNMMYQELEDKFSRECMLSYLKSRYFDTPECIFPYLKEGTNYFQNDVIDLGNDEVLLDVGACVGAAILLFTEATNGQYRKVIALEPDDANFDILEKKINNENLKNIELKKVCAYSQSGMVRFIGENERGGICEDDENGHDCPAIAIDDLNERISVIKINFAYSVAQILLGGKQLLKELKPRLIIRIGFDENVMLEVFSLIRKINPQYKIYYRYTAGLPQALTLFAV